MRSRERKRLCKALSSEIVDINKAKYFLLKFFKITHFLILIFGFFYLILSKTQIDCFGFAHFSPPATRNGINRTTNPRDRKISQCLRETLRGRLLY